MRFLLSPESSELIDKILCYTLHNDYHCEFKSIRMSQRFPYSIANFYIFYVFFHFLLFMFDMEPVEIQLSHLEVLKSTSIEMSDMCPIFGSLPNRTRFVLSRNCSSPPWHSHHSQSRTLHTRFLSFSSSLPSSEASDASS